MGRSCPCLRLGSCHPMSAESGHMEHVGACLPKSQVIGLGRVANSRHRTERLDWWSLDCHRRLRQAATTRGVLRLQVSAFRQ